MSATSDDEIICHVQPASVKSNPTAVRFHPAMIEWVRDHAAATGQTVNSIITGAVREYIERNNLVSGGS